MVMSLAREGQRTPGVIFVRQIDQFRARGARSETQADNTDTNTIIRIGEITEIATFSAIRVQSSGAFGRGGDSDPLHSVFPNPEFAQSELHFQE